MEQFATEEQQVEAIKKFWKENGLAIILGAVVGLGGLYGWRYYQETKFASQEQASAEYEQVIEALNADNFSQAKAFATSTSEPGYALLTALQLAKQAAERGDFDEAAKQLIFAKSQSPNDSLQALAALRLARVYLQQEKYSEGVAEVEAITDEAFAAQVAELKGDLFAAQSLLDKARAAYSQALEKNESNNLVKMKLDNLNAQASL